MVSQDSTSNPNSNSLSQFVTGNQFGNQLLEAYDTDLRSSNSYTQSLGVLPSIQALGDRVSTSIDLVHASRIAEGSEINQHTHLMDLLGASNESNSQVQRLSLSLSSLASGQFREKINPSYLGSGDVTREACYPPVERGVNDDYYLMGSAFAPSSTSLSQSCSTSCGTESYAIAIGNSRYLKAAQSLLEEVVHISGRAAHLSNEKYIRRLSPNSRKGFLGLSSELKAELCNNGLSAERPEEHVKLTKLVTLLEEVERRFEHYYHHMEELVAAFEVVAGLGAGNSYTALALQAMSRHFCILRDAIVSQIRMARRKILQDMPKISMGLSQLSLFDRDSRISLQQLGMLQGSRQTWRPIRGLPETSVAILRSWLFEHFLHPYPNDSEKLMLASKTGLTKNQVSNWFINARVRLWKPMIEEMYKEEFADSSADSDTALASSSSTRDGITDQAEE